VDVKTADKVVEAFVKTVMKNVVKGEKISFPGFGSFDSKLRAARVARNPKTGEAINVPEKRAPSFTMSKNFKADVADTPL
jgi:DNA-binding protein HU-beta